MAALLLNLRDVPDDEADEVRALLDANGIAFYETRPSLWGVSAGGLWLSEPGQQALARQLLEAYQAERGERMRRERAEALAQGRAPGAWSAFREHPLRAAATLLGIVVMLVAVTLPFLLIGG